MASIASTRAVASAARFGASWQVERQIAIGRPPSGTERPEARRSRTWARVSAAVRSAEPPFRNSSSSACLPPKRARAAIPALERWIRSAVWTFATGLERMATRWFSIDRARPGLLDPANACVRPDQVSGDVAALCQAVQGVAGEGLLRTLPLGLDAVGPVSCRRVHPSKARRTGPIHSASTVRLEGPLHRSVGSTPSPPLSWPGRSAGRLHHRPPPPRLLPGLEPGRRLRGPPEATGGPGGWGLRS